MAPACCENTRAVGHPGANGRGEKKKMAGKISRAQSWLREAFEAPKTKAQIILTLISMGAVVLSIIHIAFTTEYDKLIKGGYEGVNHGVEWGFTIFFTIEIVLRIFAMPKPRDYALSPFGIIDILAVAPTWLSLFFPGLPNTSFLRALRLVRLLRIVRLLSKSEEAKNGGYGLLLQLAPFMAYAFIIKTVLVILEGAGYWPGVEGLGTVISVIGFAIGVLLSTRLGTVQARMYDYEVGIANLASTARIIRGGVPDVALLDRFTLGVQRYAQGECDYSVPAKALDQIAADGPGSVGPPIWVHFHKTAQFALERLGVESTSEYTRMLRNVISMYIVALLLVMPGLTGLVSAALVVYVLGGMYQLIMNMEVPYETGQESLINAELEPLFRYNREFVGVDDELNEEVCDGDQGDNTEAKGGDIGDDEGVQPA